MPSTDNTVASRSDSVAKDKAWATARVDTPNWNGAQASWRVVAKCCARERASLEPGRWASEGPRCGRGRKLRLAPAPGRPEQKVGWCVVFFSVRRARVRRAVKRLSETTSRAPRRHALTSEGARGGRGCWGRWALPGRGHPRATALPSRQRRRHPAAEHGAGWSPPGAHAGKLSDKGRGSSTPTATNLSREDDQALRASSGYRVRFRRSAVDSAMPCPSRSAALACGRPSLRTGLTSVASQHRASPRSVAPWTTKSKAGEGRRVTPQAQGSGTATAVARRGPLGR